MCSDVPVSQANATWCSGHRHTHTLTYIHLHTLAAIAAPSGITTITVRATATGVQYMEALGLGTAQRSSPLRRLAAAKKDGGVLLGVIGNPASTAPETIETSPTPLTGFTGTQVSGGPLLSLSGTFAPPAFQCPAGSVLKAGTNTTCVG